MEVIAPRARYTGAAGAAISFHELISVTTRCGTEFIDLTDRLSSIVARSGATVGFLNVQALHTTTAVVLNEHEPLLLSDFETTLETVAPRAAAYQHDQFDRRTVNLTPDERANGHAHCRALLLNPSMCLNIADGRLVMGRWQRVFLAELDGPRDRVVSAVVVGHTPQPPRDCTRLSWTEHRFREALER